MKFSLEQVYSDYLFLSLHDTAISDSELWIGTSSLVGGGAGGKFVRLCRVKNKEKMLRGRRLCLLT